MLMVGTTVVRQRYYRLLMCSQACLFQLLPAGCHPRVDAYIRRLWRVAIMLLLSGV